MGMQTNEYYNEVWYLPLDAKTTLCYIPELEDGGLCHTAEFREGFQNWGVVSRT